MKEAIARVCLFFSSPKGSETLRGVVTTTIQGPKPEVKSFDTRGVLVRIRKDQGNVLQRIVNVPNWRNPDYPIPEAGDTVVFSSEEEVAIDDGDFYADTPIIVVRRGSRS